MPPSLDAELSRHARALRGLARALVGANDADDLVQEAALQLLQAPRQPRSKHAWLREVLHRLAGKHRRARARRQRHEQRTLPGEPGASAEAIAGHREMLRRLDQALLTLPEPYQSTVLLRYFEGLTPTAIAARTGTPLATVKSRLQRGLVLLRERLDADDKEWRAAFASVFGFERALPLAAVVTGAILMGSQLKLALGGLAAAIAIAAALYFGSEPATTAPAAAATPGPGPAAMTGDLPAPVANDASLPRDELASPSAPDAQPRAAVTGRCVDEQGSPLAGVTVDLRAHRTNDGGSLPESAWRDQSSTTRPDGCFAFRFAIPEQATVGLLFHCQDRCECMTSWRDLVTGRTIDLGDVLVPLAMRIAGRVVDTAGNGVAGVVFYIERDRRGAPERVVEPGSGSWQTCITEADGRFVCGPMPPGRYWLRTMNRQLVSRSSATFELAPAVTPTPLELVVYSDAERPPVSGIVVDEAGAPIADAQVSMANSRQRTGPDGRFRVHAGYEQPEGAPCLLHAEAARRDRVSSGPHPPGASDVRIVLKATRLSTLRVIVRAADTGLPITTFAADVTQRVAGRGGPEGKSNNKVRHWDHGIAVLPDIAPGLHAVHVDPGEGPYAPSTFVPVQVETDTEVAIELTRTVTRTLRVHDAAGAPVPATVELLDCYGRTDLQLDTIALAMPEWHMVEGPMRVVLLQGGSTDAAGELQLTGPAGRDLALRLRGPGIALQTVTPIRLDADGHLTVTPRLGAVWTGRLVPATAGTALFAWSQPAAGTRGQREAFGIGLSRDDEHLHTFLDKPFPYQADGSFRIAGIPAGTWNVTVFGLGWRYSAAQIQVVDGQQLQQDLDVAAMQPCSVTLRVVVDGKPAALASLSVYGEHARGVGKRPMVTQYSLRADAEGTVSFVTFQGLLGCEISVPDSVAGTRAMTPAFAVPAGERFDHVLDLRLGTARVRLLLPDGQPAAGLWLQLFGVTYRPSSGKTDVDGRVAMSSLPLGRHALRTRVRSLCDPAGADAYARRFGWEALENAWLDVAGIDVVAGSANEVELRLPPEWDR